MGLEQGARTSFGEQSRRPVIKPPPGRLPWFEGGLVGVLGFVGAHGMLPDRVFAQSLPQSTENTRLVTAENPAINPLTLELSSRITQEIVKPLVDLGLDIDVTGELLTNAFLDQEGNRNIVYRNIWFQVGMDGRLRVVNVLDQLNKQGLDDKLNFGLFGDPTPPKQDTAIEVGTEIREFLQSLKQVLDIGPVVGYRNYGPFEVYRTSNVALMRILEGPQANTFQLTNTGYQALVAGLTPQEVALSPLPFATGGGTTPTPQETSPPIEVTPRSFELHYESPNGMFIIDNTDGPKGFRPTSVQALVDIENYMRQYGLKKLILTPNNTLVEGTKDVTYFAACGPLDPNCKIPYLYLRDLIVDKSTGEARLEYRWADTDLQLTPKRSNELQTVLLQTSILADTFLLYKFGPPYDLFDNNKIDRQEAANLRTEFLISPKLEVILSKEA